MRKMTFLVVSLALGLVGMSLQSEAQGEERNNAQSKVGTVCDRANVVGEQPGEQLTDKGIQTNKDTQQEQVVLPVNENQSPDKGTQTDKGTQQEQVGVADGQPSTRVTDKDTQQEQIVLPDSEQKVEQPYGVNQSSGANQPFGVNQSSGVKQAVGAIRTPEGKIIAIYDEDEYARVVAENRRRRLEEEAKKHPEPPYEKSSWDLVDEAYKAGKIDIDANCLYKYYIGTYRDNHELLPSEYRAKHTIYGRDATSIEVLNQQAFENNWNNFRPETRKKFREMIRNRWIKNDRSICVKTKLTKPDDNEVVHSQTVLVEGTANVPEVYDVTTIGISIRGTFSEKTQEIRMTQTGYIPGEETFEDTEGGKFDRENYFREKEKYKDKPGLAELWAPPGQNVYHFSEFVVLPSTGIWNINVGGEGATVIYPPEDRVDTTPPVVEIIGVENGQEFEKNEFHATIKLKDDSLTIVGYYVDGTQWGGGVGGGLNRYENQRLFPLLHPGKNIFKIVAIDVYGNRTEKSIKLYYKPKEKKDSNE